MHSLVVVALLLGAGCDETSRPKPVPTKIAPAVAAAPSNDNDVEAVATRLGRAMFANDRAAALALTLTHADIEQLLVKPRTKAEWDAEVASFFDDIGQEAATDAAGAKITGAKIFQTKSMNPAEDKKVKRSVEAALVQLVIEQPGKDTDHRFPMLFFKLDAGWRFSPKQ